jgi:ESS family glutamate:Na+ symporter
MEFTLNEIAISLLVLFVVLVLGGFVRSRVRWLQALFVPTSVVAGFLGLLIGPQVLGQLAANIPWLAAGLLSSTTLAIWAEFPGLLINVVFACILLGKTLPGIGTIWQRSAPHILFGYSLSFGQYALGLILAITVLVPFFGMSPLSGGLLEISFTGGHGTAAGMSSTFQDLGFEEGTDLALGLATIGLVMGIVLGTWLVNRAVRSSKVTIARQEPTQAKEDYDINKIQEYDAPEPSQTDTATSPLTVHLVLVGVAIILGWAIQLGLIWLESWLFGRWEEVGIIAHIPLFPFTIIGGALLQLFLLNRKLDRGVKRETINQISGTALDLLIVTAIATMSLSVLGDNWGPILLMSIVALGWSVFAVVFIAPRIYTHRWFEHSMGDFGQSSGTVATGFLLINMSDPRNQTDATEAFGYKQLLFEPFIGGGLITAISLPLIAAFGAVTIGIVSVIATLLFLGAGVVLCQRTKASVVAE